MQTAIRGVNMDSTTGNNFNLVTLASRPTTTVIDGLDIRVNNILYAQPFSPNNIPLTITEFGASGQYIAGNFSGTIRDSVNHSNVTINCNFRVRRR